MKYGAHLPLTHVDGSGWHAGELASFTDAARELGFDYLAANDHLVFARPWLDGIVGLASVIERSGGMRLATTVALPVVRGAAVLAKAAAALDLLSNGRFVLGVGPGSSARDYEAVGLSFDERWRRLDESLRVLRDADGAPPLWIGSWGSAAGLRRVARLGDGWIASAYNLTPADAGAARAKLGEELARQERTLAGFPCSLATMWTYITDDPTVRQAQLDALATMLNRPAEALRDQLLIGPPEHCAAILRGYAEAGMDAVFVWPLADAEAQLERLMRDVVPLV